MDTSIFLSGEQLLSLKLSYQEKKMRPRQRFNQNKMKDIPKSQAEMECLAKRAETILTQKFQNLKESRVKQANEMGLAVWDPDSKTSKVISDKKRKPWMGHTTNGVLTYTPEETLFLMETEFILVNYMDLPMCLQTAYQLILSDEFSSRCYRIYAYLTRLGYKLKPFSCSDQVQVPSISGSRVQRLSDSIQLLRMSPVNLRLVMMPLRREMIFQRSDFARFANWTEYKRVKDPRPEGVCYDEEAIVLELNDQIRSEENIFNQLPNKSLIDYTNNLTPLIDQTKVKDINKLLQILKEAGPQEKSLHTSLPSSNVELKYQVYSSTRKSFTNNEVDHCLALVDMNDFPPAVNDLMSLNEKSGQSQPLFAITSETFFNFFTLQQFECWDEIPELWDSNRSSRSRLNVPR